MFFNANARTFSNARELRKNPTRSEEELWSRLRDNQLGVRFRRQHPVFKYVVYFYCHSHRLAVEVDGTIHNVNWVKENDLARSEDLKSLGIKVLRFSNSEVTNEIENVIASILQELSTQPQPTITKSPRKPTHLPPLGGRGVTNLCVLLVFALAARWLLQQFIQSSTSAHL